MFKKFFLRRLRRKLRKIKETNEMAKSYHHSGHHHKHQRGAFHTENHFESDIHRHPRAHHSHIFGQDYHHKHPHIHKHLAPGKSLSSLSMAKKGEYEFITTLCDHELEHRLLEMGFVPKTKVKVIENPDPRGAVLIEIKGSKIALNYKIANDILINSNSDSDVKNKKERT
jgi:Fe2+ transport system protein FeoA